MNRSSSSYAQQPSAQQPGAPQPSSQQPGALQRSSQQPSAARRVILVAAAVSALFACVLGWAWSTYASELARAQAADSFLDFVGAFVLAWVVWVSEQPSDEDHPWGHGRAEPLGALGVAMLAGMLAFKVAQGAFDALWSGGVVVSDPLLLQIFLGKVVFKGTVVALCRRAESPALRALGVDAQNDVLVGFVSVLGYWGVWAGYAKLDVYLAFPIAGWIGLSGFRLARENIDLLMGRAPPLARQRELKELAAAVPGVIHVEGLRAHHLGTRLSLRVQVSVRGDLTVREGHDIGEMVREVLENEADVNDCSVHVDAEPVERAPVIA